jgi:hypothetical protein
LAPFLVLAAHPGRVQTQTKDESDPVNFLSSLRSENMTGAHFREEKEQCNVIVQTD